MIFIYNPFLSASYDHLFYSQDDLLVRVRVKVRVRVRVRVG